MAATCIKAVSDLVRRFRRRAEGRPTCTALIRDTLLVGDENGHISEYHVLSGLKERILIAECGGGEARTLLAAFGFVWCGHSDGGIRQWQLSDGQLVRTMTGHRGPVLSLCVMGRHLYSGSEDGYVFQWALQDGKKTDYIPMTRGVTCLSAYPQRQLLIAGDRNGRCAYWDCHSRATPHMVHEYYCKMQVEAATGKTCIPETRCLVLWYPWLFVAVGECVVEQRCLDDWKLVRSLEHPKAVLTATASLDVLFTGCADGVLRTWDIQTGAMLQRFIGHPPNRPAIDITSPVVAIACHPNNEALSVHDFSSASLQLRPGTMTGVHYLLALHQDGAGCQWKLASRAACKWMAQYVKTANRPAVTLPVIASRRSSGGMSAGSQGGSRRSSQSMQVAMTVDQLDMIEEQQKKQHEALTLGFRAHKMLSGFVHGAAQDYICPPMQHSFSGMQQSVVNQQEVWRKIRSGWKGALKQQQKQNRHNAGLKAVGMLKLEPTELKHTRESPIVLGAVTAASQSWAQPTAQL